LTYRFRFGLTLSAMGEIYVHSYIIVLMPLDTP